MIPSSAAVSAPASVPTAISVVPSVSYVNSVTSVVEELALSSRVTIVFAVAPSAVDVKVTKKPLLKVELSVSNLVAPII